MSERYTVDGYRSEGRGVNQSYDLWCIRMGQDDDPARLVIGDKLSKSTARCIAARLNASDAALARCEALAAELDAEADACDELISGAALNLAGVLDARSRAKRDAAARIRLALTGKET